MLANKPTSYPNFPVIKHSQAWDAKDKFASQFFVYILKLSNGHFYAGQTRDLRERLSEHIDGKTFSTKGLSPKLQYFEIFPNRYAAEQREVQLKNLINGNEREIRRMILNFKDLTSELNFQ
jgi:predicted GIY-YIG superfamily endonuclease